MFHLTTANINILFYINKFIYTLSRFFYLFLQVPEKENKKTRITLRWSALKRQPTLVRYALQSQLLQNSFEIFVLNPSFSVVHKDQQPIENDNAW